MDASKQTAKGEATGDRKHAIDLLGRATGKELTAAWAALAPQPSVQALRGPETGLVMVRGRIGGGGAPFNLGEATVSRATVRLANGIVGFGQSLGTDREKARLAAIFDALWQQADTRDFVETRLLSPIAARIAVDDGRKTEQTAATRVDFFTMVRGED
ncbi:MAG: phosphonate C-P lyase system protein PhnG [Rhizobiaceae bacterium]|nr:phosphonate C-P lyase system protein PhnG [Rhizobiaceae bacterium]